MRSERGTLRPQGSEEDSNGSEDGPPPTPLWSNVAPDPSSSGGGGVAVGLQRQWRGLRGRWRVAQRFSWIVPAGMVKHEESHALALAAFLTSIAEEGALALDRRMTAEHVGGGSSAPPTPLPPSPPATGSLLYNDRLFSFPLTESTVLDMLATFLRGQLPPKAFVMELLHRQLVLLKSLPNVPSYEVPTGSALAVVGDLHGQFGDLMHM